MATNGEVVRASVRWKTKDDQDIMNVWHYLYEGSGDTDDNVMDTLDAGIEDIYDIIRSLMEGSLDPFDIKYDIVTLVGGVETVVRNLEIRPYTPTLPPNGSGEEVPNQVSCVVSWRTAHPRSFGRKFLPPFIVTTLTDGRFEAAAMTTIALIAGEGLTVWTTTNGTLTPGILTIYDGGGDWFLPHVTYKVTDIPATQRRRRIGVGS